VPTHTAPEFIKRSNLSDTLGYLEVHKHTLQHSRYPNVFGLGDSTNLPVSKTEAAVFSQFPVVVHNLENLLNARDVVAG